MEFQLGRFCNMVMSKTLAGNIFIQPKPNQNRKETTMQKFIYVWIAIFLMITLPVSGQVVESFDYPTGTFLDGAGTVGNGWSTSWQKTPNSPDVMVDSGGISSVGIPYASSNNKLMVTHNAGDANKRYYRALTDTFPDTTGGVYYLSFFMNNDWPANTNDVRVSYVMFVDTATLADGGPGGQLAQFGRVFNSSNLGIALGGATRTNSGARSDEGHFVVAVVYMSGDASAEDIYFFVDPDPFAPLDTAQANIVWSGISLNNGFNALGIKVEGSGPLTTEIDEIRLGTSYSEVVPQDLLAIVGPASDNFNNYLPAAELAGNGGLTGGWGGPWLAESGSSNITVADTSLTNFDLLKETSGQTVKFDYSTTSPLLRIERPLADTFPDDGSTYYVSFSTQSMMSDVNNTIAYLMLIDTAGFAPTGPGGQLVQIGKPLNTPFIGVGIGAANNFSLTGADASTAHLVVAKIKTSGNSDPDTIDLFVDPNLASEPATPDATKLIATNLNNGFNGIGIKVDGLNPGIETWYDDIYVGLSYEDVIPDDYFDVANPIPAFAYDQFTYTPGEELVAQGTMSNGWAGPWESLTDPDSSEILAGGLLNNNLLALTSGQRVSMTSLAGVNNRIQRLFESPIDTSDGEFWFSLHMGIKGSPAGNVGTLNIIDTTKTGPNFQQVVIGKQFGNANIFAAGFGTGGAALSGEQFDLSTARWLVGHMDWDTTNHRWVLDFWVDPDPASEPDTTTANIKQKNYSAANYHGLMLKTENTAGLTFEVDDLFLGRTFADVVPPDLSAIPPLPAGAVESFNAYTGGDSIVGQAGGSGWDGAWTLISGNNQEIIDSGLTSFFVLKETSGNSVEFTQNARMVRKLSGEYGDVGRTFWLGWFFDTDNGGNNVAHLVLADTATYGPSGAGGQLAQIGKVFGGDVFGIVGAPSANAPGSKTDTTHFVVAEIVTNGSAANDDIYIWLDPDLSTTPSRDTADVAGGANLTNWNSIGFKVEGNPGVTARWDDIYLGNSFGEIIPPDLSDVDPPEIPVPAKEPFDYLANQDLDGQNGGEGWGGPWIKVLGTATVDSSSIVSDRVNPTGNKARIDQMTDSVRYDRPFFNRFGANASRIWMSFLMEVPNKNIGNQGQVSLVRNGDAVLSIGGVAGLGNIGVIYNNGNSSETSTTQTVQDTLWIVVRMDLDGGSEDDTVRVWVNPVPDALPDDGNALFAMSDVDLNDGFDALRLNANGVGSIELLMDEFAIGFSYRDVSSKFGSDDPNLIAYEPFNYDAGTSLIGQGGVNAFWDGVWVDNGNLSTNEANITAGSIAFPEFETIGNKTELQYLNDGTQIRIDRPLAFPLESDGSVYWITFFMNTTDGAALNNVGNITLRNSGIANKDGQRLALGRMFGSGKLGLITPPTNATRNSTIDDQGLNWIVAKIATSTTDRDTIILWISPPSNVEPDTSTADIIYLTNDLKEGIDQVRVKAEGVNGNETPYVTEFDELRIASTWESAKIVTGILDPLENDLFQLSVHPNPFQEELTIAFEVPSTDRLQLSLHDINGKKLTRLADGVFPVGKHSISWEISNYGSELPNGFYFLRIEQNNYVTVRKLILYR